MRNIEKKILMLEKRVQEKYSSAKGILRHEQLLEIAQGINSGAWERLKEKYPADFIEEIRVEKEGNYEASKR